MLNQISNIYKGNFCLCYWDHKNRLSKYNFCQATPDPIVTGVIFLFEKSSEEDEQKLLTYERELRPFAIRNGRKMNYFPSMYDTVLRHPQVKNKAKMSVHIKRNSKRAYNKSMQVIQEEEESGEEDD